MTDRIAAQFSGLSDSTSNLEDTGNYVRQRLVDLDSYLGPLRATWSGQTAEAYETARAEWMRAADGMVENLDELAKLLALVHENYQSAHKANLAIWGASGSAAPAPGGPGGGFDVSIDEIRRCARAFDSMHQRVVDKVRWAIRDLEATRDMAGTDAPLATWRSKYEAYVRALLPALQATANTLGAIAQGLADTGNNYVDSENASDASGSGVLERLPTPAAQTEVTFLPPPPCEGPGPEAVVPEWMQDAWPNVHVDRLRLASKQWNFLHRDLLDVSIQADRMFTGMFEANAGPVFDQMRSYWSSLYQNCGPTTLFGAVPNAAQGLSSACRAVADAAEKARTESELAALQANDDLSAFDGVARIVDMYTRGASTAIVQLAKLVLAGGYLEIIQETYLKEIDNAAAMLPEESRVALENAARSATPSEQRRKYDEASRGLAEEISTAPEPRLWDQVSAPHPDPASVHHDAKSEKHIIEGESKNRGGHLHGTGRPGKTEFPASWGPDKILQEALDVAKNPDHVPQPDTGNGWLVVGTRDGVEIQVVVNGDGSVRTAFPLSGDGVVKNPPKN
ncbi:WXG100 family type VII secretion target [Saccharopolyspora taberi]|uniref:Bacterial EndoU nuclease domain-containing protein n=1 Tax=Saccharopolyspora taberi TaxID=60895 RepID=A0ABN3VLT6_9PSEU